jgi:hypothetical protein
MLILRMPCSKALPNIKHGQEKNNFMIPSPIKLIVIYPQLQNSISGKNTKENKMLGVVDILLIKTAHPL